ncbi:uncharacterized protein wge isoform X2 [Fopius arisanus]|uniref:Uncharacterized protein wge isoform X2 n=1 Tax=Fopius arisanus TaxID=64838 RepID=A0A9R1THP6_9HYME|nr:PREDICTED: uncharacterized protein LOC105271105 isoform X2 [Fopius arisanus]
MLVPPVAQGGTGGRPGCDTGGRGTQSSVPGGTATLWPLAPAQPNLTANQQSQPTPPLAATPAPAHNQGVNRYELYSLFPGGGAGSYVAATPGTPAATPARAYHATTHKERTVSESVFSAAVGVGVGGYTWGAPTPPPGSPYSPVPVTQLELLAKNLANLAPHHAQQPLSLQGLGVNVGASLHHAQHTTQHTLNLAGLHHLHQGESTMTTTSATSFTSKYMDERTLTLGGLHQGTFPPQLSLVTAGTPTLTINSFSSPNTPASVISPSTGVILHDYQSPGAGVSPVGNCQSSLLNGASLPSATACTVSTVLVQGGQTANTFVQSTTKKRESIVTAQAQTIKVENKTSRQSCVCKSSNATGKTKIVHSEAGCSRTLPVVSSWNGQDSPSYQNTGSQSIATNLVKREPLTTVPCQVAEVSTSLHATTTAVKIEPLPTKSENGIVVSTAASGIPVGIAVARQRLQHQETSSTSMRNVSLSHHTSHHASYHHFPDSLGSTTAMTVGGTTLLHCGSGGDDRPAHLAIPPGAIAPSVNATLGSTLNPNSLGGLASIGPSAHSATTAGSTASPATWPPTLWQYPTAAMPALEPVGFPQLGVGLQGGLQLVRDPSTGHLLLIHAAEQLQQAVVWPNYPHHNGPNVGAPSPLLLPPPPPPSLQLLSDMNGARLVLTENKRKTQNNVPIVKIEADCGTTPTTTIIASAEPSKALQTMTTMTGPLVPDTPLLTTLHYYPHAPALVQISQSESTQCRTQRNSFISKATSPVSCLTPPPEVTPSQPIETSESTLIGVQDASNQTDAPETDEEHIPVVDGVVKQELSTSTNQQLVFGTFNVVSSSIEKPQAYSLISKSDKSEMTVKVSAVIKDTLKTEVVSSVDQTIERVVSRLSHVEADTDEAESLTTDNDNEDRPSRMGAKMIEITEENCDSFHENLEFFGRRRDPLEQHKRPQFSEELLNKEKLLEEKRRDIQLNTQMEEESHQAVSSSLGNIQTESLKVNIPRLVSTSEETQPPTVDSSSPCDRTPHPQITVKSFDMPSIDCEDYTDVEVNPARAVKREAEEATPNGPSLPEKPIKKQCVEKCHPGIENVVEKLKKNAAAQQEHQQPSISQHGDQSTVNPIGPRRLENGLKKHILRSCKIASTSESINDDNKDTSCSRVSAGLIVKSLSDNNNDFTSSNNNFKETEVRGLKTEKVSPSTTPTVAIEGTKVSASSSKSSGITQDSQKKSKSSGKSKPNLDLSGLELLSNSILQLEHLKPGAVSESESEKSPTKETPQALQTESNNNNVDSPLGLLCALAEQRFMEEVGDDQRTVKRATTLENSEEISRAGRLLMNLGKVPSFDADRKKLEKRKHSCEDILYAFNKKWRSDFSGGNQRNSDKNGDDGDADNDLTDSDNENGKSLELSKLRLAIAESVEMNGKSSGCKVPGDRPSEASPADANMKSSSNVNDGQPMGPQLSHRKDDRRIPPKLRTKSTDYEVCNVKNINRENESEGSFESSLSPNVLGIPRCNLNLVKLVEQRSHIKLLDSIPSIPIPVAPAASPITVLDNKILSEDEDKNPVSTGYETSSPVPTASSLSSASKKRKVGRPRKLMCTSGSVRHLTETIVAKKSKSKNSVVGYLLSSKSRHLQNKLNGKAGYTPVPFKSGLSASKGMTKSHKITKSKVKPVKQTPLHNKNVISSIIAEKAKLSQEARLEKVVKLKPKLKAEAKLKEWSSDGADQSEWRCTIEDTTPELVQPPQVEQQSPAPAEDSKSTEQVPQPSEDEGLENYERCKKKKRKSSCSSPSRRKSGDHDKKESKRRKSSDCKECKECARAAKVEKAERIESIVNRCKLTSAHLAIDQLRVLTAMGGLFYAGRLSAVQAPDVYAITLDGERGNRPHIHSREEILQDAIVEICPTSTKELSPGTRLCAYWSQQYRCLYPGTSVEPSEPDSDLDDKFVSVEFDDGDSGRIALDDIRLLQPDYPVVEYDPNPLLSLGKRRRQISTSTDDKRDIHIVKTPSDVTSKSPGNPKSDDAREIDGRTIDEYRERKRLKKRRRDKLKRLQEIQEGKRKHRRHKCCEEHRKHKHRKHRKHKHRHSHHGSYSDGSHMSGGESCSGQKSEEEASRVSPLGEEGEIVVEPPQPIPGVTDDQPAPEEKSDKPDKGKKGERRGKARERQESVESRSKIAAFLPARQLWGWSGKGYRRPGAKGRAKKQFFKAIQRGSEAIQIGDSAVFLSTGRPDRPYIGRIESMWETSSSNMIVKVKWFYHPEETVGCPSNLKYPGALFESPHMDENDVQTISHKCEVLPLQEYTEKLGKEPHRYLTIYDNNDIYYLAGYYDPTTYLLTMQPGVV